jgi:hypothetical protein
MRSWKLECEKIFEQFHKAVYDPQVVRALNQRAKLREKSFKTNVKKLSKNLI